MTKKEKQAVEKALYLMLIKNVQLTHALRDVVNNWEQGGTPLEVDAAMNSAAALLERLEKDVPK